MHRVEIVGNLLLVALAVLVPLYAAGYLSQATNLWMMILFALTWEIMGGRMGYNSLGNILYFGVGMYACAVVQIMFMGYDVGEYTSTFGAIKVEITDSQYFIGLYVGIAVAAIISVIIAYLLSQILFGLRGPYFAIGTLGYALAAAEIFGTWEWVGGGIQMPVFPGEALNQKLFFYWLMVVATVLTYVVLRWVYTTRFGYAINAIRDDESKAEAMGIHTKRHKTTAWCLSAFFLGISGAVFGNMTGFIELAEIAFPLVTFGIFMVAMSLLGGKRTMWGPIIGAIIFFVIKEVAWTHLLGWQWVALGMLIIINVVFFQQGIMGWLREKKPTWFGVIVDESMSVEIQNS